VAKRSGIRYEEFKLPPALEELGCYREAVAGAIKNQAVNRLAIWSLNRFFNIDPYRVTLERIDNRTLNRAIAFFGLNTACVWPFYTSAPTGETCWSPAA